MDWLPRAGEASPTLQLLFLTLLGLGALALLVLMVTVAALRRRLGKAETTIERLDRTRSQNVERLDGLTTAVERLATHHHIGASMGHEPLVDDDVPVIVEASVDNSIPWVNPVHALQDHPDIVRDTDLPLERFADPAPISDPNMPAVTPGGRALPPVPPDPRRLRQYVAPARNITSEPITAVDAPAIVAPADEPQPRRPRHAAPDTGRHAAL